MQIEAADLRLADAVRLAGEGEREIRKIEKNGAVRVWFRGDEEREEPSREFEPGDVLEIQRPGDLFEAAPPPATVEEARERIFERMAALGWTVKRHKFGEVNDYVTDPSDTVRLKLKRRNVALQVRWFDNGAWRWNSNTRSLGSMKEFAADIDDRSAWLLRVARERAKERHEEDRARIGEASPATQAEPSASEPVIIRYAYRDGVLLGGNTREHKDAIKALLTPYQFRFSRNLPGDAAWYVQRTRNTVQPRERIELLAEALRRAGVPVVVEYTDPKASRQAERTTKETRRRERRDRHDTVSREQPKAKVGRPPDNAKRAAKLRELADKLEARANAELSADRLENTARRANMAASIRERARGQIVIAQTMRRAADAVEAGELKYMSRISSQAQIEELDRLLKSGMWERDRVLERRDRDREPEIEDLEYVEFKSVRGSPYALQAVLDDSAGLPSIPNARFRLERFVDRSKNVVELDFDGIEALQEIIAAVKRAEGRSFSGAAETMIDRLKLVDRLDRLGICNTRTLREALGEYIGCCRGKVQKGREDPAAVRKRELRFAKIPGFFPTPRELAERVVELAEIRPGMRVLEPSAGSGAIAEVIRQRHPTARLELVERQYSLREVLKADGFELVGDDFMRFLPTVRYDRIVMNPPFENRQDTEHINRALDMLAPGGRLVAIASASLASRDDAATRKLRERIAELGGRIEPLPVGSFKESGTNVNTVLVVADRPAAAKVEREPKPAAAPPPPRSRPGDSDLAKRWAEHTKNAGTLGLGRWTNLEKTSCFVRSAGDVSVTLCPAIQKHAIGACPPSQEGVKSKAKQLMLCQVDEDVEYFRGQEPGIIEAKAEAENRLIRGRRRRGEALGKLPEPAGDDFDAQELYLDALVPTRVVYRRSKPLDPILVKLGPPEVVTPDGKSLAVTSWKGPIPDDATLEVRVIAGTNQSLREFEAKLGEELIPYRGGVAGETLQKVYAMIPAGQREKLVKAGLTMHDVQFGRFGGRTVYWLRTRDGSKTYGPITATGKPAPATALKQFVKVTGRDEAQPLPKLPPGWTLDNTIVVALLVDGRHVWSAWQPSTGLATTKGEGDEWGEPKRFPRRAKWGQGGFDDFMHRAAATIWSQLERTPSSVRFRVAGPWLGVLFPSDYGKRVEFDPPTGGSLDIAQLEQEFAEYTRLAAEHAETDSIMLPHWARVAPKRIAWAKQWLRAQKRAARPKPAAKPKPSTAASPAASDIEPREETDMSAKKGKKKAAENRAKSKKATAKKAAAKKATAKKATAKKAAAKKAAAKQAAAKQAAAKKVAAKKAAAKKAATKTAPSETTGSKKTRKGATPKTSARPELTSAGPTETKPSIKPQPAQARPTRQLRFKRDDIVRFRKRSQIAAGLGVGLDKEFRVEMVTSDEGRTMVVLRVGQGKHSALVKVPPGHLAIVERGGEIPASIRACAARLAQFKGPITPKTRRMLAELAGRL